MGGWIVEMDRSELLIGEHVGAGGERLEIEAGTWDFRLFRTAGDIVAVEAHWSGLVAEVINLAAEPDRLIVVPSVSGNLPDAGVGEVGDPDLVSLPTTVALPCRLPPKD